MDDSPSNSSSSSPPSSSFSLAIDDESNFLRLYTEQLVPESEKNERYQFHEKRKAQSKSLSTSLLPTASATPRVASSAKAETVTPDSKNTEQQASLMQTRPTSFESDFSIDLADAEDLFEQFAFERRNESPPKLQTISAPPETESERTKNISPPVIHEPSSDSSSSSATSLHAPPATVTIQDVDDSAQRKEKSESESDRVDFDVKNQLLEATFKQIQQVSNQTSSLVTEIETVKEANNHLLQKIALLKDEVKKEQVDSKEYLAAITRQLDNSFTKLQEQVNGASLTRQELVDELMRMKDDNTFTQRCASLNDLLSKSIDKISQIVKDEDKSVCRVKATPTMTLNLLNSEDEIINSISLNRLISFLDEIKQDINYIKSHQDSLAQQVSVQGCPRCEIHGHDELDAKLTDDTTARGDAKVSAWHSSEPVDEEKISSNHLDPDEPSARTDAEMRDTENAPIVELSASGNIFLEASNAINKPHQILPSFRTSSSTNVRATIRREKSTTSGENVDLSSEKKFEKRLKKMQTLSNGAMVDNETVATSSTSDHTDQRDYPTVSQQRDPATRKMKSTRDKKGLKGRSESENWRRTKTSSKLEDDSILSRSNIFWSHLSLPQSKLSTASLGHQAHYSQARSSLISIYPWRVGATSDRVLTRNSHSPSMGGALLPNHRGTSVLKCQSAGAVGPVDIKLSSTFLLNAIRRTTDTLKLELEQLKRMTSHEQTDDASSFFDHRVGWGDTL